MQKCLTPKPWQTIARRALRALILLTLPNNAWGDKVYALIIFVRTHKRLPGKRLLLSDVLYDIRTSGKLNNPLIEFTTDKEFTKLYIQAVIGHEYTVPTLAVIRSIAELEKYTFPPDCCIKPTHSSGRLKFRRSGSDVDIDELKGWWDHSYYRQTREVHYRRLAPKIIVEPIIFEGEPLTEYRIFCYQAVPKLILVIKDLLGQPARKIFDSSWNEQSFCINSPRSSEEFKRPINLSEMLKLASKLTEPFSPFSLVRIDMYSDGIRILVGEITSCSWGACPLFFPTHSEPELSNLIFY